MEQECKKCGACLTEEIKTVACGNTCRECGRYCYLRDELSYLYLLTNSHLALHKIGIGTVGKDKNHLQELIEAGWSVHGIWHASDKRIVFNWEEKVFRQLQIKFDSTNPVTQGFVGRRDRHWVESVSAEAISVTALADLMSSFVNGKDR